MTTDETRPGQTTALQRLRELVTRGNPTPRELDEAFAAVAADDDALRGELQAERQLREREQKHYLQQAREGIARLQAIGDGTSKALDGLRSLGENLGHLITVRAVDEATLSALPDATPLNCPSASLILREVWRLGRPQDRGAALPGRQDHLRHHPPGALP